MIFRRNKLGPNKPKSPYYHDLYQKILNTDIEDNTFENFDRRCKLMVDGLCIAIKIEDKHVAGKQWFYECLKRMVREPAYIDENGEAHKKEVFTRAEATLYANALTPVVQHMMLFEEELIPDYNFEKGEGVDEGEDVIPSFLLGFKDGEFHLGDYNLLFSYNPIHNSYKYNPDALIWLANEAEYPCSEDANDGIWDNENEWSKRYKNVSERLALLKILPASIERFKVACRCIAEGLSISMGKDIDCRLECRDWLGDGIDILRDNPIANIPELAKSYNYDTPVEIRQELTPYFQEVASMLYMWAEKVSGTEMLRDVNSLEDAILFLFEVPCSAAKKKMAPRVTLQRAATETYEDLLFLKRANGKYRPYHNNLFAILRSPDDDVRHAVSEKDLKKAQELLAQLSIEYNIGEEIACLEKEVKRSGGLCELPIDTLEQKKRFLYELSEAVQKTKSLNVPTRKDAITWIYGEHTDKHPFQRECQMANEIRISGKKEKSISTMLDYANQGKPGTATVKGSRSRSKVAKTIRKRKLEWEDVAKDDPYAIKDNW